MYRYKKEAGNGGGGGGGGRRGGEGRLQVLVYDVLPPKVKGAESEAWSVGTRFSGSRRAPSRTLSLSLSLSAFLSLSVSRLYVYK